MAEKRGYVIGCKRGQQRNADEMKEIEERKISLRGEYWGCVLVLPIPSLSQYLGSQSRSIRSCSGE